MKNSYEPEEKGFSDKGIADLMKISKEDIHDKRIQYGIVPSYKMVDTCAGEFEASSSYYYSTCSQYDEVVVHPKKKNDCHRFRTYPNWTGN